jgi:hypothetical protein
MDGDDNEGNVVEIDQESDGSLVIMAPDNPGRKEKLATLN